MSEKKVTQGGAKQVLDRLVAEGGDPAAIVEAEGLGAIGGGDALDPAVQAALDANPEIAERLRGGDMKPIGVIVGHVMRETRGRADGGEVTRIVREKLGPLTAAAPAQALGAPSRVRRLPGRFTMG